MEDYKVINNKPNIKKVMTIEEFRKEYELGKNTAYNLAHRKDAPVLRVNKKFLFVRSKVDSWMESLIGKQI